MGKITTIQTNFTAGELSPRVGSRVDIAKYNNGLKVAENVQVLVQGGAIRRPGLRVAAQTKDITKKTRLIPFVYNRDQAYMLEVGHLYFRFYKDGVALGGTYEVATPYTEAQLPDIDYVQGADTMFIVHPSHPVYRLQRFADMDWRMLPATFTVEPFAEVGNTPAVTLTLSSAAVGAGRNFGATGAFMASDVGRDIVSGAGLATVTAYVDANNVTCQIKSAFSGVSLVSGAWRIEGTPQTSCTASAKDPVGATITLTLAANGWRTGEEIGKYVKINGGLVKITGYTSAVIVSGIIQQELTSITAAIANSWSLNGSIWGGVNGYPRAVSLHEQRLQLAGSAGYPQTLLGSRTGDYLNFELGSKDDDAYAYELSTSQIAPIQHLAQGRRLMVFTASNEMSVRGGIEKPITPTSIQKSDESTAGSNIVRPVKVGNEFLFVQRAGRKVRACGYRYDIDGFDSPDRTVFSEHITGPGVIDMAFQQEAEAQLYCVRSDGQLATSTYDTAQEVNAWGRWITDGEFEAVAMIPTATSEQVWVIVKRIVGGVAHRFVEWFDPTMKTDSGRTATGAPATVWGGMIHLAGKTVKVIGDGVYQGEFVVDGSGNITLPRAVSAVEMGLGYTAKLQMLTPEVGGSSGTAQGAAISVGEVIVRVLDTVSVVINGQTKTFRTMGADLLDVPPESASGDLRETTLSDTLYRNELTITQPNPVPFHVLSVIRKCTIND